jgi:DNA-directed RNA polymerase subunit alpha
MLSKQANRLINARNWAVLVKPEQIIRENDPSDTMYGKFVCEPLERGYGTTIGNALRRVLLASLQGAAFVSVKIAGVQHEFTTIPGVLEDVTDIILNIKQVRLAMDTDAPQTVTLNVNKKGEVTAGDIIGNQHVSVLNPELHIATLTEDVEFNLEFEVRMGKGYVPADMHEGLSDEIGIIKAIGDDTAAVEAAVKDYLAQRNEEWTGMYLVEEYPKLRDAEYRVFGRYVVYGILSESEKTALFDAVAGALAE